MLNGGFEASIWLAALGGPTTDASRSKVDAREQLTCSHYIKARAAADCLALLVV